MRAPVLPKVFPVLNICQSRFQTKVNETYPVQHKWYGDKSDTQKSEQATRPSNT